MKRKPVISSDIKSVGYDEAAHIMEVEFHSDSMYQYSRVPLSECKKLIAATSKGITYFAAQTKNNGVLKFLQFGNCCVYKYDSIKAIYIP